MHIQLRITRRKDLSEKEIARLNQLCHASHSSVPENTRALELPTAKLDIGDIWPIGPAQIIAALPDDAVMFEVTETSWAPEPKTASYHARHWLVGSPIAEVVEVHRLTDADRKNTPLPEMLDGMSHKAICRSGIVLMLKPEERLFTADRNRFTYQVIDLDGREIEAGDLPTP